MRGCQREGPVPSCTTGYYDVAAQEQSLTPLRQCTSELSSVQWRVWQCGCLEMMSSPKAESWHNCNTIQLQEGSMYCWRTLIRDLDYHCKVKVRCKYFFNNKHGYEDTGAPQPKKNTTTLSWKRNECTDADLQSCRFSAAPASLYHRPPCPQPTGALFQFQNVIIGTSQFSDGLPIIFISGQPAVALEAKHLVHLRILYINVLQMPARGDSCGKRWVSVTAWGEEVRANDCYHLHKSVGWNRPKGQDPCMKLALTWVSNFNILFLGLTITNAN